MADHWIIRNRSLRGSPLEVADDQLSPDKSRLPAVSVRRAIKQKISGRSGGPVGERSPGQGSDLDTDADRLNRIEASLGSESPGVVGQLVVDVRRAVGDRTPIIRQRRAGKGGWYYFRGDIDLIRDAVDVHPDSDGTIESARSILRRLDPEVKA